MIFSKEIICEICHKTIPFLGMASHVRQTHSLSYKNYKTQYLTEYSKCPICNGQVIKPRRFCSQKCVNTFRARIKNERIKDPNNIAFHKKFENLNENIKKEIISFYQKNIISLKDIGEKFNQSTDIIKLLLKKENVKLHDKKKVFNKSYDNKKEQFLESELGKKIIEEYKKSSGSLRSLSKKFGVYRNTLRQLLLKNGVRLKTGKEAKRGVDSYKKLNGIKGHRFNKTPPQGAGKCDWFFYNGVKYQGSWEFKLGLWLLERRINFLCHENVRRFKYTIGQEEHTYCPDFYLPDEDKYLEVKGYFSQVSKMKLDIIEKNYPNIKIEIYDKQKLETEGILSIDKKLRINIDDFRLNCKTGGLFRLELLKKVNIHELAVENLIRHVNLNTLSKKYSTPYSVMCQVFYQMIPRPGTNDFYQFCFKEFFTPEHINIIKQSSTINEAVNGIKNGLSKKRLYEIIKRFKEGSIC